MPAVVVVGAQWGDERKGKVVDILAERADIIARYQGGNNAGHTLVVGAEKVIRRPSTEERGTWRRRQALGARR